MLKNLFFTVFIAASVLLVAFAQQTAKPDSATLVGTWKVDLRSTPNDPAYFQKFEVKKIEGDTFSGTFYNSEIKNARFNRDWGVIYFAFTTADQGGGIYHTSGKIVGDKLEGTTHAINRKFLAVWRAEREK